jgi:hypothetical protein
LPCTPITAASHAVRLHVAKQNVMRPAGSTVVVISMPFVFAFGSHRILPLCRIKHMADKLAAMPRKVCDVFPGEKHDTSLIRQRLR